MFTKWAKVKELVTRMKNKRQLIVFTFSRPHFKTEVGNIHFSFSKILFCLGIRENSYPQKWRKFGLWYHSLLFAQESSTCDKGFPHSPAHCWVQQRNRRNTSDFWQETKTLSESYNTSTLVDSKDNSTKSSLFCSWIYLWWQKSS